ncbi:exodeoxyribonuclease V subunit gamma [Nocardioides zeae]|uniref:RecBCD enzyme subunit RecC n=1 Tax=Nocardioides zeae TaxID=1457234 RepID=A0A6P0HH33_9ACTN|nr:exodeoxyribonuclease V subunit gamma [Nocardioides zeae]
MTLTVHRATSTGVLADALAELLAHPVDDPFADELVVVPERGIERWLAQRLSHRLGAGPRGGDGVCAGVRFLKPHSLVTLLLDRDREDPWDPARLVWPVLAVVDAHLDEPWCAPLARHLGAVLSPGEPPELGELRRSRRWSVARRLAGLFGSYASQRPRLLADWREGRALDGAGERLPDDLHWQAELWRRVLDEVDAPPPDVRHAQTVAALRSGALGELDLPGRLSLFGHTRLPAAELELLAALGEHRDVHLWLPVASTEVARRLDAHAPGGAAAPVRADHDTDVLVHHPLLAALGRDARELGLRLAALPRIAVVTHDDLDEPGPGASLLRLLQADVRADRLPDEHDRAARTRAVDTSVQVHACHGPARQVEVLREVLVGLLADDPTLEPRDVLVMCPDVETYAPLIEAGFGLAGALDEGEEPAAREGRHPAHRLRVRLADRALGSTNPLLALAERLVALAGGRVTASDVLDLASLPAVRRRFRLADDDLTVLQRWVADAGVRWGLDAPHRAGFGLDGIAQNTWRAGLDRVLLGVALSGDEPHWLAHALPLDDVGSGAIDLAGRIAELVDRLQHTLDALHGPAPADRWATVLAEGVASLAAVAPADAWMQAEVERELARLAPDDDTASPPLVLPDVRALLSRRWSGRPTRTSFRTGTLTVATLVPMRSVPHRVVCLLGLDDGVFPRAGIDDGDDVLARRPLLGERDPRAEDRQLLLDAVMATGERLVVTYTGATEHTGGVRPPSVPVGELLTAVRATAPVERPVVVRHPLQPFHPANLASGTRTGDGLVPPGAPPFSFDPTALAGARAVVRERAPRGPFVDAPLHRARDTEVALEDLVRFVERPVREFLRTGLGVGSRFDADEVEDALPLELDALDRWGVGARLLADVLGGVHPELAREAERRRGHLPPRALGARTLASAERDVRALYVDTVDLRSGDARTLDVDVDLGDGRRLVGTVGGVHGNRLVSVGFSGVRARHRIGAWVRLLALSAGHPDASFTAHTVGRSGRSGPQRSLAGPLDHRALDHLRALVDLRDRGLAEPLPMPVRTTCAVAEAMRRQRAGDDVELEVVARREWETSRDRAAVPGEQEDPEHTLVFGDASGVEVLLGPPRDDELWVPTTEGAGFRTRIGQLAWRVWGPLVTGGERMGPL